MIERPLYVSGLAPGDMISFYPIPRWYQRIWRWFKRVVLRRKEPQPVPRRITAIDYETRTVTYDGEL